MAQAVAIAANAPDQSGHDQCLLGLERKPDVTREWITADLTEAGLRPSMTVVCGDYVLAEVDGLLAEDDSRLRRVKRLRCPPIVLGGYAVPIGGNAA